MGYFPATVTLKSLINKQTKIPNKKSVSHFRGAPWISSFETCPKNVAGFLSLFLFMSKNEHLNLNHSVFLWFDCFVRNCLESVKGNKVLVPVAGC